MAATPWLLLLCLAAAAGGGVLQARAQPDSKGFISIDCGLQGETGYVENATKLAYAPDNGEFTDGARRHLPQHLRRVHHADDGQALVQRAQLRRRRAELLHAPLARARAQVPRPRQVHVRQLRRPQPAVRLRPSRKVLNFGLDY